MAKGEAKRKAGVCRVCRCTDEQGCHVGCSWADKACTICSACFEIEDTLCLPTTQHYKTALFGIWMQSAGPGAPGAWVCDKQGRLRVYSSRVVARFATSALSKRFPAWTPVVIELVTKDADR